MENNTTQKKTNSNSSYSKKKKFKIVLPENFQEILIIWEMKFEQGDKHIETVRNILYMYSVSLMIKNI
jgi:hypothetical protein